MDQLAKTKRTSQEIGAAHERAIGELLERWGFPYLRKPRYRTKLGATIELDFILRRTNGAAIVLECKDFAVDAKNPADSKRRKTQEALWLLIQVKRYCRETDGAHIVLITGPVCFEPEQEALLRAELGEDFSIVCISDPARLEQVLRKAVPSSREA